MTIKIKITILLISVFVVTQAMGQQKEWNSIFDLLQKEAAYFQGKKGFIQPEKSDYSRFIIDESFVSDSLIVFGIWLRGRSDNEASEQYVKETIVLGPEPPIIIAAEIYYDYSFYFKEFPNALFLRIELDDDVHLINHVVAIYKDLKTGQEDRGETEDTTNRILLPIRAKNRAEILKAIDAYQAKTLKYDLEYKSMF